MINYDDSRRDITIETTPGPRTQSRLIIREPQIADSGNYTCNFILCACYIFVMQTKKDMKTLSSIHYLTFFVSFVCRFSQQYRASKHLRVRIKRYVYVIILSGFLHSHITDFTCMEIFWGKRKTEKQKKRLCGYSKIRVHQKSKCHTHILDIYKDLSHTVDNFIATVISRLKCLEL